MPKLDTSFPVQSLHVDRSLEGSLPGPHDSHAVCRALATLLPSLHTIHSWPSTLTLPASHRVHITSTRLQVSPDACLCCVPAGCVPGKQAVLDLMHVALSTLTLGNLQS